MAVGGMSQYPIARKPKETPVATPVTDNDADDKPGFLQAKPAPKTDDRAALAEKVGKQQAAKARFQKFAKGAKPAPKGASK